MCTLLEPLLFFQLSKVQRYGKPGPRAHEAPLVDKSTGSAAGHASCGGGAGSELPQ